MKLGGLAECQIIGTDLLAFAPDVGSAITRLLLLVRDGVTMLLPPESELRTLLVILLRFHFDLRGTFFCPFDRSPDALPFGSAREFGSQDLVDGPPIHDRELGPGILQLIAISAVSHVRDS